MWKGMRSLTITCNVQVWRESEIVEAATLLGRHLRAIARHIRARRLLEELGIALAPEVEHYHVCLGEHAGGRDAEARERELGAAVERPLAVEQVEAVRARARLVDRARAGTR